MSTDIEWEKWGKTDPYYGVLTDPRFRSTALNEEARTAFFDSGRRHVSHALEICRRFVEPTFRPRRVLDFGCGVGRIAIPLSEIAEAVVGMDVSPSMLAEARANAQRFGRSNIEFVDSDDTLASATGEFDLVHTSIVLQHIEVVRGRRLFAALVDRIAPGGLGVLHVTFASTLYAFDFGQPPAGPLPPAPREPGLGPALRAVLRSAVRRPAEPAPDAVPEADPEMQMNCYNLSELLFLLQRAGVERLHVEMTDHGGILGAFLYFTKPASASGPRRAA